MEPNAIGPQLRCASNSAGDAFLHEFLIQPSNGSIREHLIRAYRSRTNNLAREGCDYHRRGLPMDSCYIATQEAPLNHCRRDLEYLTRAIARLRNRETMDDDNFVVAQESGRLLHFYCTQVHHRNCDESAHCRGANDPTPLSSMSNFRGGYLSIFLIKETYASNGMRHYSAVYARPASGLGAHSLANFPATSEGAAQCEDLKRAALTAMRARPSNPSSALQTGGAPERSVRTR